MPLATEGWRKLPRSQRAIAVLACYTLIFAGAIDIGRALYQATH